MNDTPSHSDKLADKLALVRTSLANDRTLLAWVRTAIGIIGFGFSFYKFFEFLRDQGEYAPRSGVIGPHEFAFAMILCGNLALFVGIADFYRAKKRMIQFYPGLPRSRAPWVASFVLTFGIVVMIATLLRL